MPTESDRLEEAFFESDSVRWTRLLPWLHLFRAVWMAVDLRKLILAAGGLAIWWAGVSVIEGLPFYELSRHTATGTAGPFTDTGDVDPVAASASYVSVVYPIAELFTLPPRGASIGSAVLLLLWSLLVWGLVGGAISRITALQFSEDHPTSLLGSVRYAGRRLLPSVGGPLLPLSAVVAIGLAVVVAGWVSRIPAVGEYVVAVFWWLVLAMALFAALLLVGLCLTWPLMVATIAVEGTDAFDALSRAFSYLTGRFWYAAGLVALATVLGLAGAAIVQQVGELTIRLGTWFIAASGTDFRVGAGDGPAEQIAAFWQSGFLMLVGGFLTSYFWVAVTLIYFLLRRSVDATPLDRVYIPDTGEGDPDGPLVGIPATERREDPAAAVNAPADPSRQLSETTG